MSRPAKTGLDVWDAIFAENRRDFPEPERVEREPEYAEPERVVEVAPVREPEPGPDSGYAPSVINGIRYPGV